MKVHPFKPQPSESLLERYNKNHKGLILKCHISILESTLDMSVVKNEFMFPT
jgi:hypothetical protein